MIVDNLNEPVLSEDHLMFGGYWYVIDGKPKECEHFNGESNRGITVEEFKRRYRVNEVRRCDIVGRTKNQPKPPERSSFDRHFRTQMQDDDTIFAFLKQDFTQTPHRWQKDGRTIRQAARRPRPSNKIKKVK